jgi:hypothetical protein
VAVSTVGRRYTDTVKLFLAVGPSQPALEKASGTAASLQGA